MASPTYDSAFVDELIADRRGVPAASHGPHNVCRESGRGTGSSATCDRSAPSGPRCSTSRRSPHWISGCVRSNNRRWCRVALIPRKLLTQGSSPPVVKAQIPIFIVVRDLLSPLQQLVAWLERAGHERIVLIDNDSTYPPMVEYLVGYTAHGRALWLEHGPPIAMAQWRGLRDGQRRALRRE